MPLSFFQAVKFTNITITSAYFKLFLSFSNGKDAKIKTKIFILKTIIGIMILMAFRKNRNDACLTLRVHEM